MEGEQEKNDEKQIDNPELLIQYDANMMFGDWGGTFVLLFIAFVMIILLVYTLITQWSKFELDWALIAYIMGIIITFILTIFSWPKIPSTIQIFPNHIIFTKSDTRLFNPKRQLPFKAISFFNYNSDIKRMTIVTKTNNLIEINLEGAEQTEINNLIELLRTKIKEHKKIDPCLYRKYSLSTPPPKWEGINKK